MCSNQAEYLIKRKEEKNVRTGFKIENRNGVRLSQSPSGVQRNYGNRITIGEV
jgi:hypothetical protein